MTLRTFWTAVGEDIDTVLSKPSQFEGFPYNSGNKAKRLKNVFDNANDMSSGSNKHFQTYLNFVFDVADEVLAGTTVDPFGTNGDKVTYYMFSTAKKYQDKNIFAKGPKKYKHLKTVAGNNFYGDAK